MSDTDPNLTEAMESEAAELQLPDPTALPEDIREETSQERSLSAATIEDI